MSENYVHNPEYKVEVRNLTKNFGDLKVLNNISFNIKKGEFVIVIGQVGAGKSAFVYSLLGELVQASGVAVYPKSVAYVPQSPWILVC